jgi:predicted signal transduction protein with EAL and GGDEF domain
LGLDQPSQAQTLATRIIERLGEPFDFGGREVSVGVSVGIAYSLGQDTDTEVLLKQADIALYRAKSDGRRRFCFFDQAMNEQVEARHVLEMGLRSALIHGQFELLFQPILDAKTEALRRFEALIRWRHPQCGLIEAADFIAVSEETGLIVPIGEWVIREACRIARSWPDEIPVAVNVAVAQLKNTNFRAVVVDALRRSGLPAGQLELEITESALLQNAGSVSVPLRLLQELGVRVTLDDFGKGSSSLQCLRDFPFNRIKIDQSFIQTLDVGHNAAAVLHALMELARAFGMSVTAEGVETTEQMRLLRAESCPEVQGRLFSRPLPAEEISSWIIGRGPRWSEPPDGSMPI